MQDSGLRLGLAGKCGHPSAGLQLLLVSITARARVTQIGQDNSTHQHICGLGLRRVRLS